MPPALTAATKRQAPSAAAGERQAKRAKGVSKLPIQAEDLARGNAELPQDAVVKRTDVLAGVLYLGKRSDKCDGRTVRECLKLEYKNAAGVTKRYTLADLRYDLKGKRVRLVGGTKAKPTPVKSACLAKRGAALKAVSRPNAAVSLASAMKLSSGTVMPVVGFGTYKLKDNEVGGPVGQALKLGYRLIDTAQVYENEKGVGAALRASGLPRSDVFIETKVWRSSHGYERTIKACHQSLKKLCTDYVDLYVIHWPGCKTGWPLKKGTMCPKDWTPAMRDTGTWRAMEDLYQEGKVKAIGVTNYSVRHLKQLMKSCRIKPMINQVEFHPRLVQTELLEFCQKHGIVVQAYASLGSGDAAQAESFFDFPPVKAAASAHNVTPAQVLLRWAMEKGCVIVPKSMKAERISENAGVFNFKLSAAEVKAIDKLHSCTRYAWKGLDPDSVK